MFAKIAIFSCLLAFALSAPAEDPVAIVSQNNDASPDGSYEFSYESADGSKQEQSGAPKPLEKDEVAEVVHGSASWTDPEGGKHSLSYVADENGFQPQSDDIPQAPEVPAQIAKALEYIEAHPPKESD